MNKQARRRGIFLLPNLFTTGCLIFGFLALVSALEGAFGQAAGAVLVAMIFDGLDGRIARATGTQTDFGVQYDSLADMVSFGLTPAAIIFIWAFGDTGLGEPWGNVGWLIAFVYVACAALRLARFNTQSGVEDKRYFQGLPSPAAAGAVVGLVWFGEAIGLAGIDAAVPAGIVTAMAAVLMVSAVRYVSFKEIDLRYRVRFTTVVGIVGGVALVAVHPPTAIFLGFFVYLLSGPVWTVMRLRRMQRRL